MSIFRTLLAKDLREQRFTLLATLGAGLVLIVGAGLLLDRDIVDSDVFARVGTMAVGGLAALAVGCDLGARDRGEGSHGWLLRQPVALRVAVGSRLATLMIAIGVGLLGGMLTTYVTSLALADGNAVLAGTTGELVAVACVLAGGLWSAAASAWLPRGFLAAPGGLVACLFCSSPAWFGIVWYELFPDRGVGMPLVFGVLVGGLGAFVAGMLFGARRWDSMAVRATASLTTGSLAMTPLWFAATAIVDDALEHDVDGELLSVTEALIAREGGQVLITASEWTSDWRGRDVSQAIYLVDPVTGEHRAVGEHGSWIERVADTRDGRVAGAIVRDHEGNQSAIDGSGNLIDVEALSEQAWEPELELPARFTLDRRAGAGWRVLEKSNSGRAWFAPESGALLESSTIERIDRRLELLDAWWLGSRWLVRLRGPAEFGSYALLDAEAEELAPASWLDGARGLLDVLPDGRAVVTLDEDGESPLVLVDDVEGTRTPLTLEGHPGASLAHALVNAAARDADRPWIGGQLRLSHEATTRCFLLDQFDAPTPRLRLTAPTDEDRGLRVVGPSDDGALLALGREHVRTRPYGRAMHRATILEEGAELWRLPLDGAAPVQLFPPAR